MGWPKETCSSGVPSSVKCLILDRYISCQFGANECIPAVVASRSLLPSPLLRKQCIGPFDGSQVRTGQGKRVPAKRGPSEQSVHTYPGS